VTLGGYCYGHFAGKFAGKRAPLGIGERDHGAAATGCGMDVTCRVLDSPLTAPVESSST